MVIVKSKGNNIFESSCSTESVHFIVENSISKGLPGGAVVKNLHANAGDTGSSPVSERSHMLWSN